MTDLEFVMRVAQTIDRRFVLPVYWCETTDGRYLVTIKGGYRFPISDNNNSWLPAPPQLPRILPRVEPFGIEVTADLTGYRKTLDTLDDDSAVETTARLLIVRAYEQIGNKRQEIYGDAPWH